MSVTPAQVGESVPVKAVAVPSRCSALSHTCHQSLVVILPYLNPGSSPPRRQIVVSTTVVDSQSRHNDFCISKYILCSMLPSVLNLCVLLAPGSPTLYLPALHPVCSSICLPSTPVQLLFIPYCEHPPSNIPLVINSIFTVCVCAWVHSV